MPTGVLPFFALAHYYTVLFVWIACLAVSVYWLTYARLVQLEHMVSHESRKFYSLLPAIAIPAVDTLLLVQPAIQLRDSIVRVAEESTGEFPYVSLGIIYVSSVLSLGFWFLANRLRMRAMTIATNRDIKPGG